MIQRLFCLFVVSFCAQLASYELSICAIFQNEAPYLKEWIEFHKLVGVEHFYLYNNVSKDNPEEVLRPYVASGEVTLFDWSNRSAYWQLSAYNHCLELARGETKWLAFIDIDEFIVPMQDPDILTFLQPFEEDMRVAAVSINWQVYGTSWLPHLEEGELLVEKLVLKAPEKYGDNNFVKAIVRPEYTHGAASPHHFRYTDRRRSVDPNGRRTNGQHNPAIPIDAIRINHYWLRTEDFAYGEKLKRIEFTYRMTPEQAKQKVDAFVEAANREEDLAIFPWVPALRDAMGFSQE